MTSSFPRWDGDATTPFVLHLAQDLQNLGWSLEVLAPHAPGAARREVLCGVRVERFPYLWPASLQTVCYQGGALINLRSRPFNVLKLPALVFAEWLAIMRRLMSGRYDLVNSHWILPQGFTGALATRALGLPHVTTVHGGDVFALRGRALAAFKRFTLRRVDAVTVNSSATWRAVTEIAPDLPQLHRIPMGISRGLQPRTSMGHELRRKFRRGQGPLLLFVGRVVEEKGVVDLLHAVALLAPRLPDVTAVIVGEGQDRAGMEKLRDDLGLGERVRFTGWVAPERVPDFLECADIFVGPSRKARSGWQEAQGLTFLEAMQARLPVVATRTGGIADAVRHRETGILVDQAAPREIASAVLELVGDPALAGRLCDNGAALVAREYSREASAQAFTELFQTVLSTRKA